MEDLHGVCRPGDRLRLAFLAVLLAAAGCATTTTTGAGAGAGAVRASPARPADEPLEAGTALGAGAQAQSAYAGALEAMKRGDAARDAGNQEGARTEWTRAADGLLATVKAGASAWRLALSYEAAVLLGKAGDYERTAALASEVARDPAADDRTRALGWHLAAEALVNAGSAQARAGKLPPIKLAFAEQRGAAPLAPQPPPGTWKSFVGAVDAYLPVSEADPDLSRPPEQRTLPSAARLAIGAAKVFYSFDDMPEARRRLEAVLVRWPDDPDALVEAIPLYLQTFLLAGDRAGHQAAASRLQQLLAERSAGAEGKAKEGYARARDELGKATSAAAFLAAQRLLDAGKPAEAAQAFEAVAVEPASADAASALHNAAIAWDRAGDPARAAAARDRILREHADSRVAPSAALTLAAYQSRKGDHAAAARVYGEFLERWPDHANRCIAMQNVAAELDVVRRPAEAAERYLAFGRDPGCSRADQGLAVVALRRARTLFDQAGKAARAKEAAAAAEALARKPAKEKGT
jgi:hypothetical protein